MKRLTTFLATTLLLLMLVPKTAGAVDFYVKKVADTQNLYLWTTESGVTTEWLGAWGNDNGKLSDLYVDADGTKWYKKTVEIPANTEVNAIVFYPSGQSKDSDKYTISSTNSVITIDWNGDGNNKSVLADGSNKTFTEMLPNKIRYRVKGSTGAYVIRDVNFGGETKINLVANKDYEFQISDENGIWYGLDGSASMVVGGANDWYLYANQDHCYLLTLKGGEYTFKVSKASGHISVTVVYPGVNLNDYKNKLMYRVDGTSDPANIVSINYSGNNGTAKVQLEKGKTYKFKISNNPSGDPVWFGSDGTIKRGTPTLANLETGKTARIVADMTGEYTFTVSWSNEIPSVAVTYPEGDIPAYTLRYKVKDSSDPFQTVKLTDNTTATVSLQANTTYEYEISGPNSVWFGDQGNGTMSVNNCSGWSFYKNKQCYIKTNTAGEYKFTVNWESTEKAVVSVAYPSVKVGKYYLVVPDENVGNTPRAIADKTWLPEGHKAFEMIPSRERNSTVLNNDLTTVTLKIDGNRGRQLRYDSNHKIKFYIYDETNDMFYRPNKADYDEAAGEIGTLDRDYSYVDNDGNVQMIPRFRTSNQRDAIGRSHNVIKTREEIEADGNNRYYYIEQGSAAYTIDGVSYPTMSLTFMFSKYNGPKDYILKEDGSGIGHFDNGNCIYYVDGERKLGNAHLLVAFLKTRAYNPGTNTCAKYYTEHITKQVEGAAPAGLYLIGNFGQKFLNGSESEYEQSKYKMEPNYWYDGVINNTRTDIQNADSIVYSVEIRRGDVNWDKFFLSFTTGDALGQGNDGDPRNMWNPLLRPRVQNQMDAQALEGGIFYYLSDYGHGADQSQSLNPLLSEEQKKNYASYRVYFNATYSTYRIEFYDKFCIAGPAVNGQSDNKSKSGIYFNADHRHGMVEESVNGRKCYRYRGEFKNGSTFAFFVNPETSAYYYCEDDGDNAAVNKDYTTGYDDGKVARWHVQAPVGEDGVATGADYPYHNRVAWKNDGSSDINNPALGEGNAILWTLPDGVYTLRFYNHGGNNDSDNHAGALYTIDKEVELKNASSTFEVWNEDKTGKIEKTFEYGGLRTFSDDCALMLPLGVKAYYANSIDEEKGKVILKEVADNIIPAHCPVLIYDLSMKSDAAGKGRTASKTINLSPVPESYTEKLAAGEQNYLVDCYKENTTIQPIEGEGQNAMYNYFMSNIVYLNGATVTTDAPLNFWKVRAGTAKKNYTYLSVPKDIRPVFYTGEQNYVRPGASEDVANGKRSYCFILSFGDVDDDNVVTGITSVNTDDDKVKDGNAWYTIQGIRIAAPKASGIYIHNGKKVILK